MQTVKVGVIRAKVRYSKRRASIKDPFEAMN